MRFLAFVCFFLSGFSSLVYEVLWTRSLSHVIGGSSYAVSIILSVFMGGLGLGGLLGGRLADRLREPSRLLIAYGLLEAAIGLYAMALPPILERMRPAFAAAYGALFGSAFAYNGAVFLLCSLPLLLPVLCMGATLPLLGRFQSRGRERLGGTLGFLYGLNTLGAAAGVAGAGFWLLPALGLRGATLLAAAINLAVGIVCAASGAAVARRERALSGREPVKPAPSGRGAESSSPKPAR